jgi:NAD(P)-dependent dehydrogenase (short-subunit alcohol dehydrogenase family)
VDLQLAGKVAVVTGGTRGIGRAIVDSLVAEGMRVPFCARTKADVNEAEDALRAAGADVAGTTLDVTDGVALTEWVGSTADRFGGLDVVIANASALAAGPDDDNMRACFEVDLMHTKRLVDAARPHLEASKGAIVAISSVAGREVDFFRQAYGVIKAALVHYIAGLAYEFAPRGVRANSVSPGNVYSAGGVWPSIEQNHPEMFAAQLALNPGGRMGMPEEVAYCVTMLASPRASYVTGTNLIVDGALTRGVQL